MNVIDVLETAKGLADTNWHRQPGWGQGHRGKTCSLGLVAEALDLYGDEDHFNYFDLEKTSAVAALAAVADEPPPFFTMKTQRVYLHNDKNLKTVAQVKEFFDRAIANYVNANLPEMEIVLEPVG